MQQMRPKLYSKSLRLWLIQLLSRKLHCWRSSFKTRDCITLLEQLIELKVHKLLFREIQYTDLWNSPFNKHDRKARQYFSNVAD